MNKDIRELNIDELGAVSGGLMRNPDKDAANQRVADQNNGQGFGATIGNQLVGSAHGGYGGQPFDYPN